MTVSAKTIIKSLIDELSADNDCNYYASKDQKEVMKDAIAKMQMAGIVFDLDTIQELTCGERKEVEEKYRNVPGFKYLDKVIEDIFNGD